MAKWDVAEELRADRGDGDRGGWRREEEEEEDLEPAGWEREGREVFLDGSMSSLLEVDGLSINSFAVFS